MHSEVERLLACNGLGELPRKRVVLLDRQDIRQGDRKRTKRRSVSSLVLVGSTPKQIRIVFREVGHVAVTSSDQIAARGMAASSRDVANVRHSIAALAAGDTEVNGFHD